MQTMECIRKRRSVRDYKNIPVSEKDLMEILEAATCAPSSGNVQDWEFIVVQDTARKKELQDTTYGRGQSFISTAPVIIIVCSDLKRIENAYGERGRVLYSIQNTAAAIQNLMLAACDKGLGTCWVGAFSEDDVRRILGLPEHVRPVAMITVGYPASEGARTRRIDVKDAVHREGW